MFQPQKVAMSSHHRYFLSMELVNSDPVFVGYFDSRVKCLRERTEQRF